MKRIATAISIIVVMLLLYMGFPTGTETLNVKFINSASTPAPNFNTDSANTPATNFNAKPASTSIYYIDVTLDSGEKIQIQSTDPALLSFNGGYLYDINTYYSLLRFKTIYVLKTNR